MFLKISWGEIACFLPLVASSDTALATTEPLKKKQNLGSNN